ncbi:MULTISPECIES: polyamine ABC transporter ATP-binding protein [Ramlibacter]|uniref:Spermidine/putrescine import ATP-binding protein PotA n=1 Tax=Ramlibacter pinisoli TaxID=2682844 RepID=A0A6N8INS8_9BURK|nr:ABC transporter ATP-binding protein [Ramlibacter sp. CGMCC 1.13660]MVQ28488.1 polyamine ABC transporter ATP-binding protein [Ramlibacter pinisoli]
MEKTRPDREQRPSGQVEFRDISKSYQGVMAADCINLKIGAGEFVSLLGPSGSGKTTLLMLLAGFIEPTAGQIFVDGKRLDQVPPNRRNQGIVFQSYALFPNMTVRENVAFPLKARGVPEGTARELIAIALKRVRMVGFENRYPSQLSGGQQQRIALARAIVFDPPLILMDESLSALDRKLRQEMRVEIKDLHSELGKTIIYVTHDQEEALTMSDRVVVLQAGRIAQIGHPLEVYEDPCNAYVAGFVGDANFIDGVVQGDDGNSVDIAVLDGVVRACTPARWTAGQRVRVLVRPEAVQIEPHRPGGGQECGRGSALAGVVSQIAFLGDAHQYHIEAGGQSLMAKVARSRKGQHFSSGDKVEISFHSEDLRVFALDA